MRLLFSFVFGGIGLVMGVSSTAPHANPQTRCVASCTATWAAGIALVAVLSGLILWGMQAGVVAAPLHRVRVADTLRAFPPPARKNLLPVLILQVDNRQLSPELVVNKTNHVSLSAVINYNYAIAHGCECEARVRN